jgi:hypothetical protein
MKLIIIYGPPAAGKLTVANEISRLTGYKVFHNHISIDYVKSIFEFGTPGFWSVVGKVRYELIAEAARQNISLIHTFCYEFAVDDDHFASLIASAEDFGGEVHLVLLTCDDDERRKRIANESRVMIGKLVNPEAIGSSEANLTTPYPGRDTLAIDTTSIAPEDSAEQIIAKFGLDAKTQA